MFYQFPNLFIYLFLFYPLSLRDICYILNISLLVTTNVKEEQAGLEHSSALQNKYFQ